jgi:hypothetical protein
MKRNSLEMVLSSFVYSSEIIVGRVNPKKYTMKNVILANLNHKGVYESL